MLLTLSRNTLDILLLEGAHLFSSYLGLVYLQICPVLENIDQLLFSTVHFCLVTLLHSRDLLHLEVLSIVEDKIGDTKEGTESRVYGELAC